MNKCIFKANKIISLLLIIVLVFQLFPLQVFAKESSDTNESLESVNE